MAPSRPPRREGQTIRYATAKDRVRAIIGALQDSYCAAGGPQDKETGSGVSIGNWRRAQRFPCRVHRVEGGLVSKEGPDRGPRSTSTGSSFGSRFAAP